MSSRRMKLLAVAICLAAFTGSRSRAQQQEQKPEDANVILHAETRVVLVDAVVTDKKGGYVRDLKQKDFKVYEDGKEMQVKSFSFEADPNSPLSTQPR
ncbi:MAG TPA: hypothetical protein VKS01_04790, partial [Bryobacteraceae bacterium]|nr:hypothetical protein [Bryobacteraceae bacterium]